MYHCWRKLGLAGIGKARIKMRFLLDTNILIPLEDSQLPLKESLANFVRLANSNGHELIYHPASEDDIKRDTNEARRQKTLQRLKQYSRLNITSACPWNKNETTPNDKADNEILYAIHCEAAHALITEDQGIHRKAKELGINDRVYNIQTAEDWLSRLYELIPVQLPDVQEISLHNLVPILNSEFFDSLRDGYEGFNDWFRKKAREGIKAWVVWEADNVLGAICIHDIQTDEKITETGLVLNGDALKLSTFKVARTMRGKKTGELFLKAAFRYATANKYQNIFIHGELEKHSYLFNLLEDFGFEAVGQHPNSSGRDIVYLKEHPTIAPAYQNIEPFNYLKKYFPHFQSHEKINKYIVPICPAYHNILFPDFIGRQPTLFQPENKAGNAIKQAYLCHAQSNSIKAGDIVLFYRSEDEKSITSIGVVEDYRSSNDPVFIAQLVSRRTVYNMEDIEEMIKKNPKTKAMLFRIVYHLENPVPFHVLKANNLVKGAIQSIQSINHQKFESVLKHAGI
jgi:L-amino acid N-acyltransferase YncA/predicted nucleic acid-binding protein